MSGVLEGLRIADFSQLVQGPNATQMLADMGADVVKIEPLQGDWQRNWSLRDAYIMSLYEDDSGLLCIGTRSGGVSRWNPRSWELGGHRPDWLAPSESGKASAITLAAPVTMRAFPAGAAATSRSAA